MRGPHGGTGSQTLLAFVVIGLLVAILSTLDRVP